MPSFFDLVASLQSSIDNLDAILTGGDTEVITISGVNKNSIAKSIKDQFSALQGMLTGRLAYSTKVLMDTDTGQPNNKLAEVWYDPIVSNNGLYGWSGSSWIKSKYDAQSIANIIGGQVNALQTSASQPNLFGATDWHDCASRFVNGGVTRSVIDGVPCAHLNSNNYAKAFMAADFPSDKMSLAIKIEKFGTYVSSGNDRILLIQYDRSYGDLGPNSSHELARSSITYTDEAGPTWLTLENVVIASGAVSIYLYFEPDAWPIDVSHISICDGSNASYKLPPSAYFKDNLFRDNDLTGLFLREGKEESFKGTTTAWSTDANCMELSVPYDELSSKFGEWLIPAVGSAKAGNRLRLTGQLYCDEVGIAKAALIEYDKDFNELSRHEIVAATAGSWVDFDRYRFAQSSTAYFSVRLLRLPNSAVGQSNLSAVKFRKIFLASMDPGMETQSIPSSLINNELKKRDVRLDSIEKKSHVSTLTNLLKDPEQWTGFKRNDNITPSVIFTGGAYQAIVPAATTAKEIMPASWFHSGFISAGVMLSKASGDTYSARVLLLQYSAAGAEVAREQHNIPSGTTIDENDQSNWLVIEFSGIALNANTAFVHLYCDAGITVSGIAMANPWVIDGEVKEVGQIAARSWPNLWIDPAWSGVGMTTEGGQLVDETTTEYGYPHLRLTGSGTPLRRYELSAIGYLAPGREFWASGEFKCDTIGAEIGFLFMDSNNSEISRKIYKNTSTANWSGFLTKLLVPDGAVRIQLRFILWADAASATFAEFRHLIISPERIPCIHRAYSEQDVNFNKYDEASKLKSVHVSPTGNDNNLGTLLSPVLTAAVALSKLPRFGGHLVMHSGDYVNFASSVAGFDGALRVTAKDQTRPRIIYDTGLIPDSWSLQGGTASVYYQDFGTEPYLFIWEHETPQHVISELERHPLQRGRTHRLPSFRLKKVSDITLCESSPGSWFYDVAGGRLYIHKSDSMAPTGTNFYLPTSTTPFTGMHSGLHFEMTGVDVWYGRLNVEYSGSYQLNECRTIGSSANGLNRGKARGIEYRCEFAGSQNDGSNGHNGNAALTLPAGDVPPASQVTTFDLYCHDNYDDGDSLHERCEGSYHGGLLEYNGDRGIATAYGAHVTFTCGVARHNGQYSDLLGQSSPGALNGGEGFAVVGATAIEEGGVGTQMTCISCLSYGNNINFAVNSVGTDSDAVLEAVNSISEDAKYSAFKADKGRLILRNCTDSGSIKVKDVVNGGLIIVKNSAVVS